MSTTSIDTTGLTSTSTLTNEGADDTLQLTGLASGINTDELIEAELAEQEEPMDNMADEIEGMDTENETLSSIQDDLQAVSLDADMLAEPSLFFDVQDITSSDDSLVSAATTDGAGAVVGSYTVAVSSLASAAQRTFQYTTPTASDTLTIDGQDVTVSAGETAADLADAINSSDSLDVWATTTTDADGDEELVLSSRTTGDNDDGAGTYIDVQDNGTQVSGVGTYGSSSYVAGSTGTVLTEVGSLAEEGADAAYSINGGATQYSTTDTVTDALAGVTLTLSGVTGDTPVTITTASPGPDVDSIVSAVQQFVTDYNSAISLIETEVNTAPTSETDSSDYDPNSGSLFGDDELENLLSDMRDAMVTSGSDLPTGLASMADIGITTGESTGSVEESSVDGELTVDTTTLEDAIESDPSGVESVLQSWANSFTTIVNDAAGPDGAIAGRIDGNDTLVTNLTSEYDSEQTMFTQEEENLEEQWASVESTLEDLDDQKTTLSTFADSLTDSSSDSSS